MEENKSAGSLLFLTRVVLVAALGGLLFGYDTAVIAGAIGFLKTHFVLSPAMKGWAASCALVGCFLGLTISGPLNDRFGRKNALIVAACLFLISAVGSAFPRSLTEFVIYRIIGGFGVGIASMTSPMYIAEISPARIRGRMVCLNQLAIVSGMLIVYFVNYYITGHGECIDQQAGITVDPDKWNVVSGWRWMFGSESIPAVALLVLMFFVPKSPRWLAKQGQSDKAFKILARVDGEDFARTEMSEINNAIAEESPSIKQLLNPGMRIALFIGIALAVLQQVVGINVFLYYAPEIFKSVVGTKTDIAMMQTVVVGGVNLVFTIIAIWSVDKLGRKPLMYIGSAGMGVSLVAAGLAFVFHQTGIFVLICVLGYIASFAMSVGPVVWVILSEIFPTKIRGRAMAIATFFLWVANYIVSQTFPMMNENKFLIEKFNHGFPFFIYSIFCVVLIIVVWKFVPETKGKSLEEIEKFWKK